MLLVAIMFLSNCSFLQNTEKFVPEKSAQIGEALLPQDLLFLIKFNTADDTELKNYQELKKVLVPIEDEYKNKFFTEIKNTLKKYNLDFENDIKPLFGERTETIIAVGGNLTAHSPDIYIVQKLKNVEKSPRGEIELVSPLVGLDVIEVAGKYAENVYRQGFVLKMI
jgi:hypothetical protein